MISIIVPIYKVERYLPKCIDSLIAQTYKDIEVILVDDGSPDRCPSICDEYAQKDNRIVVIHQENKGVSVARNAGLNIANGQYIGFVDPDDWVAPDMYKTLVEAIEHNHSDMAVCGYEYYDELGHVDDSRRYKVIPDEVITQKEVMSRFADMPPTLRHVVWNKIYRKEMLGDIKFKEDIKSSEDVYFLNDYVVKINSAVVIHQPLYMNLVREGSATHGGLDIISLAKSFDAHNKMYIDTVKRYPELKKHAQAFLLDVFLLKYNESKRLYGELSLNSEENVIKSMQSMRKCIRKNAVHALFNSEIYWKTRLAYLILR